MINKQLAIIGAGSLGVMTLDTVLKEGNYAKECIVFIDSGKEKGTLIYDIPIIGGTDIIKQLDFHKYNFVIAIADNGIRKMIAETYDLTYVTIRHPDATTSELATIGSGCIILPNSSIDPGVIVKDHVIINKNTSIGHDSELQDFTQVSPGCSLGGYTKLQQGVFLGLGTNVLPEKTIGQFTTIGAGSTVTKDIQEYCTAIGSPCKPIKLHEKIK